MITRGFRVCHNSKDSVRHLSVVVGKIVTVTFEKTFDTKLSLFNTIAIFWLQNLLTFVTYIPVFTIVTINLKPLSYQ